MNTVLFVNATIGFSENLYPCYHLNKTGNPTEIELKAALWESLCKLQKHNDPHPFFLSFSTSFFILLQNATKEYSSESVCVCVRVCFCTITQKETDLGT